MIQFERVSKSWDGGQSFAVQELSLTVEDGTVLALLGGSGCGKSTTVKMVNRLVEMTSGTITIDGRDIRDRHPVELRRSIGYVFQAIGLFPHMTIGENVDVVARIMGDVDLEARSARIERLLSLVELDPAEYADRYPAQLSGGQRQRVGFARALASDPKLMLLDEPFGALDPVTRDTLQTEFQKLQKSLKFTAILVTHDMAEALLLADKIAVMHEGRMLRFGTPMELLHDPGHPYVTSLLDTPRRHGKLIQELIDAAGDGAAKDERTNENPATDNTEAQ